MFFVTETYMDPVAITTLGINAKTSASPIGYFGTGLKYAIAVLVKNNHRIIIKTKKKNEEFVEYVFSTRKHSLRDKEFEIIQMNGEDLGFTTELGKNWEIWMALRELYCNTIDEGGEIYDSTPSFDKDKEMTVIEVRGKEFRNCWFNRHEYFLDSSITPTYKGLFCDIYTNKPSKYLYYRGIRVCELPENITSNNTYNITYDIDLTEDRTVKYLWQAYNRISATIKSCNEQEVIHSCVSGDKSSFELQLTYENMSTNMSENFINVVSTLFKHFPSKVNKSAVGIVFQSIGEVAYDSYELNDMEKNQLNNVLSFLQRCGYDINLQQIHIYKTLGENVLGMANLSKKRIFLSKEAFRLGNKQLAITILEEFFHLETNAEDFTRKFQEHILTELVTVHEKTAGISL